jgi:hypothetical protein
VAGVLDEIGGKLADRWVSLLALPGMLFLGTAWAAHVLGWSRPFDAGRLVREVARYADWVHRHGGAGLFLVLVGVLLLAVVPGLVVQALARLVQVVWLGPWPGGAGRPLVERRGRRRLDADRQVKALTAQLRLHTDPAEAAGILAEAQAAELRRDAIALVPPVRPTRMGDRMHALEHRIAAYYRVPFAILWPRLWLAAPQADRKEVAQAAGSFDSAARLCGWGVLYLALGAATLWWPAFLAGAAAVGAAWWLGRERLFILAELVEALVDLRLRAVARAVGLPVPPGPVSPETGQALGELMRRLR